MRRTTRIRRSSSSGSSEPWHSRVTATATLLEAGELPALGDPGVGPGNAAAWMFYRAALGAIQRLQGFFDDRVALGEVKPVDGRRSSASRPPRRGRVTLVDDHDLAWQRFCRRRAEYEPLIDALARLVDAPAGLWPAHEHAEAVASPSGG